MQKYSKPNWVSQALSLPVDSTCLSHNSLRSSNSLWMKWFWTMNIAYLFNAKSLLLSIVKSLAHPLDSTFLNLKRKRIHFWLFSLMMMKSNKFFAYLKFLKWWFERQFGFQVQSHLVKRSLRWHLNVERGWETWW